jgi:hypothetical protein
MGSITPGDAAIQNWKPSGNAVSDFFLKPRAAVESPIAAAQDYGIGIGDYATAGLVGKALGPGAQEAINQAHQNLGLMDYAAQAIGYGAGPGQILGRGAVGAVGKLAPSVMDAAAPLAARIGGSMAAGGLEGAGAGALGTYGHNQGWTDTSNVGTGALLGALYGAAGGAVGGSGPAPKAPEVGAPGKGGPPTGMYAQKEAAYQPLNSIYFDTAHQQPLQGVWNALKTERNPMGQPNIDLGVPQDAVNIVRDLSQKTVVTGRNLQKASMDLRDVGGPEANRFADALDGTLQNAQPMPGSIANGAPAQVGQAGAAQKAGNLWHGRIKDLEALGTDPTAIPAGAVKQVQSFPQNAPGAGTPQSQALATLAKAQKPSFNWWTARHIAAPVAGAAAGGLEGYFNAAEGQSPLTNAAIHAGEDALLFGGMHAAAAPRPASSLNAARYAIATGKPISDWRQPVGNALVDLMVGHAASGQ